MSPEIQVINLCGTPEADDWVRREWLGLKMQAEPEDSELAERVLQENRRQGNYEDVFVVRFMTAMDALVRESPMAARSWIELWLKSFSPMEDKQPIFQFPKGSCKIVEKSKEK